MKLTNFGGGILWDSLMINRVGFCFGIAMLLLCLFSCNKRQLIIDSWKYQEGLIEKVVVDTIQDSRKFNNPYLLDIVAIDSIVSNFFNYSSNDTSVEMRGMKFTRTETVEVKTDTENYFLFRGDLSGDGFCQNLNFIFEKEIGVIAYYVYGRGYVRLISRKKRGKEIYINQMVYERMMESEILFSVQIPDTLKVYDFTIQ